MHCRCCMIVAKMDSLYVYLLIGTALLVHAIHLVIIPCILVKAKRMCMLVDYIWSHYAE